MVSSLPCVPGRTTVGPSAGGRRAGGVGGFCFRDRARAQARLMCSSCSSSTSHVTGSFFTSVLPFLRLSKDPFRKVQLRSRSQCSVRPHAARRAPVFLHHSRTCACTARRRPLGTRLRPALIKKGTTGPTPAGSKRVKPEDRLREGFSGRGTRQGKAGGEHVYSSWTVPGPVEMDGMREGNRSG